MSASLSIIMVQCVVELVEVGRVLETLRVLQEVDRWYPGIILDTLISDDASDLEGLKVADLPEYATHFARLAN